MGILMETVLASMQNSMYSLNPLKRVMGILMER